MRFVWECTLVFHADSTIFEPVGLFRESVEDSQELGLSIKRPVLGGLFG